MHIRAGNIDHALKRLEDSRIHTSVSVEAQMTENPGFFAMETVELTSNCQVVRKETSILRPRVMTFLSCECQSDTLSGLCEEL